MKYTKDKPTLPGFYWVKHPPEKHEEPYIGELVPEGSRPPIMYHRMQVGSGAELGGVVFYKDWP